MSNNNQPVLEIENLRKTYGDVQAVKDVSLRVERGDIYGFLGPNGAGKTTTIGMILGLIHRDSGIVRVLGQPVTVGDPSPLRRVGSLIEAEATAVPHLSARNNLHIVAELHTVEQGRIDDVLATVGLTEAADRQVGSFSTGMKQRLGLAMALLHDPDLLVLDEPTNGLDPAGMREVRELLLRLADAGKTIFLSSHLLNEVEQVCNRVAVLKQGEVIAQGRVDDLLGGAQVVEVVARQPEHAASQLRQLNGGSSVRVDDGRVLVSGSDSETVMQHLLQQGITPQEVRVRRDNLEDLFLELTE
jgi:ABC-2 type transport system ATP-binding protein